MINYILPSIVVLLNIRARFCNSVLTIHQFITTTFVFSNKCGAVKYNELKCIIFNRDHENNNITFDGKYTMHKLN